MRLTPRARIQAALRGEPVDHIPFTVYWLMFPRGEVERRLRNEGVAVVERVPVYHVEMPNVQVVMHEYYVNNVPTRRETVRTPVGEVYATKKLDPSYGTSWWNIDYYIKEPDDYKVVEFMVRDTVFQPNYEAILLAQERLGEDGYVIGNTEYTPMNKMIYDLMGVERFGLDLHRRSDDVLSLYWLLREKQREMYRLCAESPAEMFIYGGNIHQEVVGLRRFQEFYLPCLNEFADVVHSRGKLSGCHLDAPMASLVGAVAGSKIDVVEAFTPVPTCDVTVAEARQVWPDKVLWLNFPSSVHLESPGRIREETLRILREAAPGRSFLIGITEDIPEDRWRNSLTTISQTVLEWGSYPLQG
jgi:uroporphyrinogen-III decarboxylase